MLVLIISNILINLEIFRHIKATCDEVLFQKSIYKADIYYMQWKRGKRSLWCLLQIYLISYCKAIHFLTSLGNNKQLLFAEDLPCWIVWTAVVRLWNSDQYACPVQTSAWLHVLITASVRHQVNSTSNGGGTVVGINHLFKTTAFVRLVKDFKNSSWFRVQEGGSNGTYT